jgi:peptidoglycan L-alanyl-D-glutamate endopeptidase CwlK
MTVPVYGNASRQRLATIHPILRTWCESLLMVFDHTIVCGYRGEEEQEEAFRNGKSKLHYPNSYHNTEPLSHAVDLAPWDGERGVIDWDHPQRFIYMAGVGIQIARGMGIPIVWGGDWDMDTFMRDHEFKDFPHFQIPRDY